MTEPDQTRGVAGRIRGWLRSGESRLRGLPLETVALAGLLVLILVGGWVLRDLRADRTRQLRRAESFARLLAEHRALEGRLPHETVGEAEPNPLSYLEERIGKRRLAELTPTGQSPGGLRQYRVKLETIALRDGFDVVRRLEREQRVEIREMTLERLGRAEPRFDLVLRLVRSP